METMTKALAKVIENLQEQIEAKDEKIDQLESELEKANYLADKNAFFRPRTLPESDLPVPRLQIELIIHDEYRHEWFYVMVYRHTLGHLVGIPMGGTISNGGHKYDEYDSKEAMHRSLPFRDGVHIRKDSTSLNLPAYAIAPGHPPVLLDRLDAPLPL